MLQYYFMKGTQFSTIKEEKDLGVLITNNQNQDSQCATVANKATLALRFIYLY